MKILPSSDTICLNWVIKSVWTVAWIMMIITLPQLLSTFQHLDRLYHAKLSLLQNVNVTNAYTVQAEWLETNMYTECIECTLSVYL